MAEILELESLHYYGDGHDKIWVGAVVKLEENQYCYMAAWGRRGAAMQNMRRDPSSLNNASSEFHAKVYEKERKGYKKVSWDLYGIRNSVETLIKSFSTGANPVTFNSRPDVLVTQKNSFDSRLLQELLQNDEDGLIQAVEGTRKRIEYIPGKPCVGQDANGNTVAAPEGLNAFSGLQHQLLLDGVETADGRFAILDIFEIDESPLNWLPYPARMGLFEKEITSAGINLPFGHTIENIPAKGLGVLAATSNKISKLELISSLGKLGSSAVYFRNMMSAFEANAKLYELDLSPIV